MATPTVATDGSAANAALFNKYLAAGGGKATVKVLWARIRYTGSAWEVHATTDAAELVTGNLSWSVDHLNVVISGFTVVPVVLVSPTLGATRYRPEAIAASTTQIQIQFKNASDTVQTTQGTDMDCMLLAIGL